MAWVSNFRLIVCQLYLIWVSHRIVQSLLPPAQSRAEATARNTLPSFKVSLSFSLSLFLTSLFLPTSDALLLVFILFFSILPFSFSRFLLHPCADSPRIYCIYNLLCAYSIHYTYTYELIKMPFSDIISYRYFLNIKLGTKHEFFNYLFLYIEKT